MIVAPPSLQPPAIAAPAPREVSFGLVSGTVAAGTRRVVVRVGATVLADRPLRGRRFSLHVRLPARPAQVRVTAVDGSGRRSSAVVGPVFGLPGEAEPRAVTPRLHPALARDVRALTARFGGSSAAYVQDLSSGYGAAWNAAARFPAASTLKLAIAVTVLGALDGTPPEGSQVAGLLQEMVVHSDNRAANALEIWLAGSTSAGSARVNETLGALGLHDTEMYGGYALEPQRLFAGLTPIPIRVESQPSFGLGKYTTAWDLARLARAVYLAAAGKGPLLELGVTGPEARHLLWLLAQVGDGGKLGRFVGGSATILHKAGWLPTARHDNGIVVWSGGAFVAAVLTWSPRGVDGSADELAGRVAAAALRQFRGVG